VKTVEFGRFGMTVGAGNCLLTVQISMTVELSMTVQLSTFI